jgi:hypothetical protein
MASSPFAFPGGSRLYLRAMNAGGGPRALTPVNVRRALWFQTLKGLRGGRACDDEQWLRSPLLLAPALW